MRRLLISFSGGILIPLILFAFTALVGEFLEYEMKWEWAANLLMYSFAGPLKLWDRVFPPPSTCPSCGPTNAALIATVITVFIFYASLTHVVQIMIEKFQNKEGQALSERRA
jgi:hypothetical protein